MSEELKDGVVYMNDEEYQVFKKDYLVLLEYRGKEESFAGISKEESEKLNSEVRKHDPTLAQPLKNLTVASLFTRISHLRTSWQSLEECNLFLPALNEILDSLRGELHKLQVYELPVKTLKLPKLTELACLTNNVGLRKLWMSFHKMLNSFEKALKKQQATNSYVPPEDGDSPAMPAVTAHRSHGKGDAEDQLIAALTKHHKYSNGFIENYTPIGGNQLARLAGNVSNASVTALWKKHFNSKDGIKAYKRACTFGGGKELLRTLRLMNNDYSAKILNQELADAYQEGALGMELDG